MKRVMKEAMGDCSTTGEFRFLVRCQECGRTWHSSPVRFSKAGAEPETEGMRTIFHALYEQEREAAREKAAAEASEIFSRCPVCGRLVCDRCGNVVAEEAAFPQELPAEPAETIATEGDGST